MGILLLVLYVYVTAIGYYLDIRRFTVLPTLLLAPLGYGRWPCLVILNSCRTADRMVVVVPIIWTLFVAIVLINQAGKREREKKRRILLTSGGSSIFLAFKKKKKEKKVW